MAENTTSQSSAHTGGCHCGAVRFEVKTGLHPVISCNCSICDKTGALLTFAPAGDFTLLQGADHLSDYQFNRKVIHHLFCKTCGVRSFSRGVDPKGSDMVAVNVRCLDGVDLAAMTPMPYDGRSL